MNRSISVTILKSLLCGYNFFGISISLNKGIDATSTPNNQCFLPNNHVEKALPTPTTTTKQTLNHLANKKFNLNLNCQKVSRAFFIQLQQPKKKEKT
jgi:hypothetical protein